MLKYVLLASTFAIASPAFAQEAPAADTAPVTQQAPVTEPAAPAADAAPAPAEAAVPAADPMPATAAAQPTPSDPAAPAEAQPATAAAAPPPGQPATNENQVAAVVTQEFSTYDKDASGALDKTEFGAWMVALRKASQPTFVAGTAEATAWLGQAFAQADKDKNATVNQAELTTFLTPKPA